MSFEHRAVDWRSDFPARHFMAHPNLFGFEIPHLGQQRLQHVEASLRLQLRNLRPLLPRNQTFDERLQSVALRVFVGEGLVEFVLGR